jgi:hypothetical protein
VGAGGGHSLVQKYLLTSTKVQILTGKCVCDAEGVREEDIHMLYARILLDTAMSSPDGGGGGSSSSSSGSIYGCIYLYID